MTTQMDCTGKKFYLTDNMLCNDNKIMKMIMRMIKSHPDICRYPVSWSGRRSLLVCSDSDRPPAISWPTFKFDCNDGMMAIFAMTDRRREEQREAMNFLLLAAAVDLLHFLLIFREATEQLADNSQLSSNIIIIIINSGGQKHKL